MFRSSLLGLALLLLSLVGHSYGQEGLCFSSGFGCFSALTLNQGSPAPGVFFSNGSFFGIHNQFGGTVKISGANVTINPRASFELDASGNLVIVPGIPADKCQLLFDEAFLPFGFDFAGNPVGTYSITMEVDACDGTVIASQKATISIIPPVPPPPPAQPLQLRGLLDNGKTQTVTVPINGSVDVHVPLGAVLTLAPLDPNNAPVPASFSIGTQVVDSTVEATAIFPSNVIYGYSQVEPAQQSFQSVHEGSTVITLNPNADFAPISINVKVEAPDQLGTSHIELDSFIIPLANKTGILPQYIKGQMAQESGKDFNPKAYRYEPLSPYVGDFGVISRFGTAASPKVGNFRSNRSPYSSYRFGVPNGDCLNPNGLPQGVSVIPDDITPRSIYAFNSPTPTAEEMLSLNNARAGWSNFNPRNYQTVQTALAAGDHCPINFIAQTSLAGSYGYLQIMYVTAVGKMRWAGTTDGARNPSLLFDTPANIAKGGGSVDLAADYLRGVFWTVDKGDAQDPQFNTQKDMEDIFLEAWVRYNGAEAYGPLVLKKTRRYPPQDLPANPKPLFDNIKAPGGCASDCPSL
jgi:hypothetical protein